MNTQKSINYDLATEALIDGDVTPTVFEHNYYEFDIQIYDSYPTKTDLSDFTTFKIGLGNVGSEDEPLVEQSTFVTTDYATGYITCVMNCASVALTADMGTVATKIYALELKGDDDTTIMLTPIYVKNTVYPS